MRGFPEREYGRRILLHAEVNTRLRRARGGLPPAPTTPQEAGLSLDLLTQLALKTLHFSGELTGGELAKRMGLNFSVMEPAIDFLKSQRQVEIAGGSMVGRASYRSRITDAGRTRAALFLDTNHYGGVAPVPFEQYRQYMLSFQKTAPRSATRDRVRQAFSHLVISQPVLDQLGPAINAGHSMFVYGPPMARRHLTAIRSAARRSDFARDQVEGLSSVFDAVNHEPHRDHRRRLTGPTWAPDRTIVVLCRGPVQVEESLRWTRWSSVTTPERLLPRSGAGHRQWRRPGLDDSASSRCPRFVEPRIVPLESRVDFLTLQSDRRSSAIHGARFFATPLNLAELVDEASWRDSYKFSHRARPLGSSPAFRKLRKGGIWRSNAGSRSSLQNYYAPRKIALRAASLATYRPCCRWAEYRALPANDSELLTRPAPDISLRRESTVVFA